MVAGQGVLSGILDVGALTAVEARLEALVVARGEAHVAALRNALELHRVYDAAGLGLSTVAHLALVLRCSELRAGELLADARLLLRLPGAFEAVAGGLLTVEGSQVLTAQLGPLDDAVQLRVWERLQAQLMLDAEQGVVRPPARLRELLRQLVVQADPDGAEVRRRDAAESGGVEYRRRDDSLVDIYALGLTAPNAQACLSRIAAAAAPLGLDDPRTADQRRRDAFVSLLLGREQLPFDTDGPSSASGCGCSPTASVPWGAQVQVLVPLGAAMGTTDELAELVGHGPIEPDLLDALLHASPELRAVFVGDDGVPVASGDRRLRPERGDPAAVRAALLDLAGSSPPAERVPRHPDDHRSDRPPPGGRVPDDRAPNDPPPGSPQDPDPSRDDTALLRTVLAHPHPVGAPGPYRVPARLRRLLIVRAPRCEWPGCGARAVRCDLDHDTAWPCGPTCGCNLGPLCRRHHRVKQTGWTKTRTVIGVRWASPAGRTWTSLSQHQPPAAPHRPLRPAPALSEWDTLSPWEQEQALWDRDPSDPRFDDPAAHELRAVDTEPTDDEDSVRKHLEAGLTRWTLDLEHPYAWTDLIEPEPTSPSRLFQPSSVPALEPHAVQCEGQLLARVARSRSSPSTGSTSGMNA